MRRVVVMILLTAAVVAGAPGPAGAEVRRVAVVTDSREGTTWVTAQVACPPGVAEIEVDAYITQHAGGDDLEAFADLYGECGRNGMVHEANVTGDGSDQLRPGPATVLVTEFYWCEVDDQFVDCGHGSTEMDVMIRPGRTGR